jgi:MFS family permease
MPDTLKNEGQDQNPLSLPRNIWAVSLTSFLMDVSSEMVLNILPLFLANVLGVKTSIIGLIEGLAESISSILRLFSGWLSDKLHSRKWLAVMGYEISALAKPFFYFASSWEAIGAVRWMDRVGKGVRTAPRDALVADSIEENKRGLAFGFHRAADTGGAMVGLLIALAVVWWSQSKAIELDKSTFQTVVLVSLIPAVLAVLTIAIGAREVPVKEKHVLPRFAPFSLGRGFTIFIIIVGIFELGNSSDAFLILRAQDSGINVIGILGMLAAFNLVYALISTPAGLLSDRIGRQKVIIAGWLLYSIVYAGFGLAKSSLQIWILYISYGFYYGLAYGTSKAIIADLVDEQIRGSAYGTYNALIGLFDFPASLIAGILWQGIGKWQGFGAPAPFLFGSITALCATLLLAFWFPKSITESKKI